MILYKLKQVLLNINNVDTVGENIPPKYEIIMVPSNHSFSNIALAILPLVNLLLLILFASFFVSLLCSFFDGSISKFIALPTIAKAIVVALKGESEKITITFR
jgi:hypothetical protein